MLLFFLTLSLWTALFGPAICSVNFGQTFPASASNKFGIKGADRKMTIAYKGRKIFITTMDNGLVNVTGIGNGVTLFAKAAASHPVAHYESSSIFSLHKSGHLILRFTRNGSSAKCVQDGDLLRASKYEEIRQLLEGSSNNDSCIFVVLTYFLSPSALKSKDLSEKPLKSPLSKYRSGNPLVSETYVYSPKPTETSKLRRGPTISQLRSSSEVKSIDADSVETDNAAGFSIWDFGASLLGLVIN